jgi:hypothetical protein
MVTQCYNLVTDVNCEKERMYVCESETIVAVVGSLEFGEKKDFVVCGNYCIFACCNLQRQLL